MAALSQLQYRRARRVLLPLGALAAFWAASAIVWAGAAHFPAPLAFGLLIGMAALTVVLFIALPRPHKDSGRRLTFFVLSLLLFLAAIWTEHNVQIEGLFFGLLAGVFQGAVLHYLIAKLVGPLIFGRVWCGWACWVGMLTDLLPYRRSPGRLRGRWERLRYVHVALSALLVTGLWFGAGYQQGVIGGPAVLWLLAGCALYDLLAVGMALALKDNRAFCKYLCPVAVPLSFTTRLSLLKVRGERAKCAGDQACTTICPMDIRVSEYVQRGERVLASECILCQECINVCDQQALTLSFGRDLGGLTLLRERPSEA